MAEKARQHYEDLFATYPAGASKGERHQIDEANKPRVKFFLAIRFLLKERFAFPGAIPAPPQVPLPKKEDADDLLHGLDDIEKANFVSVAGLLLANNFSDPLAGKRADRLGAGDIKKDKDDLGHPVRIARQFVEAAVDAVREFNAHAELFEQVYLVLKNEGTSGKDASKVSTVYARQVAEVTERLVEQHVSSNDPQLRHRVLSALAKEKGIET